MKNGDDAILRKLDEIKRVLIIWAQISTTINENMRRLFDTELQKIAHKLNYDILQRLNLYKSKVKMTKQF